MFLTFFAILLNNFASRKRGFPVEYIIKLSLGHSNQSNEGSFGEKDDYLRFTEYDTRN